MSLFRICLPQNFRYQPRSGWPAKGIAIDENFRRRNTLSSKPSHRRFIRKSVVIWLLRPSLSFAAKRKSSLTFKFLFRYLGFSAGYLRLIFDLWGDRSP